MLKQTPQVFPAESVFEFANSLVSYLLHSFKPLFSAIYKVFVYYSNFALE